MLYSTIDKGTIAIVEIPQPMISTIMYDKILKIPVSIVKQFDFTNGISFEKYFVDYVTKTLNCSKEQALDYIQNEDDQFWNEIWETFPKKKNLLM